MNAKASDQAASTELAYALAMAGPASIASHIVSSDLDLDARAGSSAGCHATPPRRCSPR